MKKAINFDLSQASLKKYYPNKSISQAYYDIAKEMEILGFEHRQYSGYVSKESLTPFQLKDLLNILVKELPWLPDCVEKFDITNIGRQYDYTEELQNILNKQKEKSCPIDYPAER